MALTTVDLNGTLFLSFLFIALLYFWWDSQNIKMMSMLTMIIIPYDYVVMILYTLPLYILDADILAFVQIIFIIISIVISGYTLDTWNNEKKAKKESG